MRTSFHHQPEAQHPHSPAIYTPVGRLPHLLTPRHGTARSCFDRRCSSLIPAAGLENLSASNGFALGAVVFITRSDALYRMKRFILTHGTTPYARQKSARLFGAHER